MSTAFVYTCHFDIFVYRGWSKNVTDGFNKLVKSIQRI